MVSTRVRGDDPSEEARCEACAKTVPREQTTECASCRKRVCRLCVRWYGHFMLVCEECRAAEW
jgi:hypothetical protein